jgi:hypothetical protein
MSSPKLVPLVLSAKERQAWDPGATDSGKTVVTLVTAQRSTTYWVTSSVTAHREADCVAWPGREFWPSAVGLGSDDGSRPDGTLESRILRPRQHVALGWWSSLVPASYPFNRLATGR